ncbi:hypothetical protein HanXRQr2_Chr01g0012821 [Helianthus annuus]|uniref:Uncharacterized protein n=1 Tax=Helianthus annuus TaxID=4232 RepID=A0A9K3JU22_HELAN|nr:hypothetical protein HanXRQr2_Chr01g0012821 [Helianthus annuus]KAJ0621928.1 hypothetical protein HanIR_Chr01g0014301 [Helianthus annuus]KAJ0956248.1 hypothetical protein HanPSC8_Chr01g0012501 [Helianthus annuus]
MQSKNPNPNSTNAEISTTVTSSSLLTTATTTSSPQPLPPPPSHHSHHLILTTISPELGYHWWLWLLSPRFRLSPVVVAVVSCLPGWWCERVVAGGCGGGGGGVRGVWQVVVHQRILWSAMVYADADVYGIFI